MPSLTSNQFYYGLNQRFDARMKLLVKCGFKRITNPFGSFFARGEPESRNFRCVPAMFIMHATNRAYRTELAQLLNRGIRM